MSAATVGCFSFDLRLLPSTPELKLSDATDFAYYGGIRSIVYEGELPFALVDDGELALTNSREWTLETEEGWLRGPKYVEVAKPGGIMFGIEDSSEPDPAQTVAAEARYQARVERHERLLVEREAARSHALLGDAGDVARAPYPKRLGPESILPFWKAEIERRRETFIAKLNAAARSGDVRFVGTPINEPVILDPIWVGAATQAIPSSYFIADRAFEEDLNSISAVDSVRDELDFPNEPAAQNYTSYENVAVDRASFLRFLKVHYPEVLSVGVVIEKLKVREAIELLAQVFGTSPDLVKAEAARQVGWKSRSKRFENEIWPTARLKAGLPRNAPPGRKPKSTQT